MTKLYITNYPRARYVSAIRAVRLARQTLNVPGGLREAQDVVDALRRTGEPQLVGHNDDRTLVESAQVVLTDYDCKSEIDLIGESPEDGQELDDAHAPPVERVQPDGDQDVAASAIVLMALCQGNPSAAMAAAGSFYLATGDPIWEEVRDLLTVPFDMRAGSPDEPPVVVI